MTTCAHKNTRFLACSAADRFPGKFICDDCGDTFAFDPNNPKGVRYLDHPNPRSTKSISIAGKAQVLPAVRTGITGTEG